MKSLDVDWREILRVLPAWRSLSLPARCLALEYLKPSGLHPAEPLEGAMDELVAAGFAEPSPTGLRVGVPEPMRPLVKVLRALDRGRVWEHPTEKALAAYLQEHFTTEETRALDPTASGGWGGANRQRVAELAASAAWVEGFLACGTRAEAEAWERQRRGDRRAPHFEQERVLEATRRLVRSLLSRPEGVPLAELLDDGTPAQGAAFTAALHYLLAFAALDASLEPRVGAWPPAVARLARPAPTAPEPVEAVEAFHAALRMEDTTSVLVAAAAEPLRLRGNDGAVFARTRQAIAERLVRVPEWMDPILQEGPEERVERASSVLRILGLAEVVGNPGEDFRLRPTKKGARWLGLSDRDRLAALMEPLRKARKETHDRWGRPLWSFSPVHFGYGSDDRLDLRGRITEAFLSVPEGFVRFRDFYDQRMRTGNPLLEVAGAHARAALAWGIGPMRRPEDAEARWAEVLGAFLVDRLAVLGGVRLGVTADGDYCFALTDAGRYLLGAAEDFEYGFTGEASVIVQPDFEVVFLALAPKLEAQIARFCERAGAGPGVMFRITRASVMGAAEAGLELEQVQRTLEEASTQPVPENVTRQIRDWFGQVRKVRMRTALLLDCPDAETAARVRAAAGAAARTVTPTLLEIPDQSRKARSALLKRLRAGGIFVDG